MREVFERALRDSEALLNQFRSDQANTETLELIGQALLDAFRSGNKAMICGNGGSMADAMHFAEEWTGKFRSERSPYPVIAIGADPTHLTCVANDYGFDSVFARQVEAFAKPGDLLFLLSTSGNSQNLLRAAESAKRAQTKTIGFLGKGGGSLRDACDLVVVVPGATSDRIQELHMLCLHALIEAVELQL